MNESGDDRADVDPGDRTLLIVENDLSFAKLLVDAAHEAGFKALVTAFGAAALTLTRQYQPSAITLDISLPDLDGWRVLERLKSDFDTRHIPVKIITTGEDVERGRVLGAVSTLAKPVKTREALVGTIDGFRHVLESTKKELVLLHRPGGERDGLAGLLAADDVTLTVVTSLSEAIEHLRGDACQCLVLGVDLADEDIRALAEYFGAPESPRETPIIVYGRQELYQQLHAALRPSAAPVSFVSSPERLLDQSALMLHRPVAAMPERQRRILEEIHHSNRPLAGRKAAHRRRRHPEHLRAHRHPRTARHAGRVRRDRPGRHRDPREVG